MPSSRVTRKRITLPEMFSEIRRTLPSQNNTFAPDGWKLKISSLGPQLLVLQGQSVGPFIGERLLLMKPCMLPATLLLAPETPLPWSGSAQRLRARSLLGVQSTPKLVAQALSEYLDCVKGRVVSKFRGPSSAIAMVLLRPSVISAPRVPPSASAPLRRELILSRRP